MIPKTLFERFDDRYHRLAHDNINFRVDDEIHGLVNELNEDPKLKGSRRRAAVVTTIHGYISRLKENGDYVSKSQSTLHDNRLKSLILHDIILSAKTGSPAETRLMVHQNRENPDDLINSKTLIEYLKGYADVLGRSNHTGELYFLIHDRCNEFLNLQI